MTTDSPSELAVGLEQLRAELIQAGGAWSQRPELVARAAAYLALFCADAKTIILTNESLAALATALQKELRRMGHDRQVDIVSAKILAMRLEISGQVRSIFGPIVILGQALPLDKLRLPMIGSLAGKLTPTNSKVYFAAWVGNLQPKAPGCTTIFEAR